jgi:hypothetical protein
LRRSAADRSAIVFGEEDTMAERFTSWRWRRQWLPYSAPHLGRRPRAAGARHLSAGDPERGVVQHYILHIPTGYTGQQAFPVVFVLHGFGAAPPA